MKIISVQFSSVQLLSRVRLFATPWITALFTIARTWKQPRCPLADEWIRKLWHIYTMEYYSAIKSVILPFVTRWMGVDNSMLSEISSVQFSSVTESCLTLCNPMDCSMPGLPVGHQLPEFTQTHVHWVGYAIQLSHLLSSPSPPALSLSQH